MFSVLFPGQGSQSIGMIKDFYDNFEYVKNLFDEANDAINVSLSKLISELRDKILDGEKLEGP